MATIYDFATKYADMIRGAVVDHRRTAFVGYMVKSADAYRGRLVAALREIGRECEGLVYVETEETITEADKQELANEVARQLGYDRPGEVRRLIKGGSVDSLLVLSQQMEALFQGIKK